MSGSKPFLGGLRLAGPVVTFTGHAAEAALDAVYSAVHHRRMSRLSEVPDWLAVAHALDRAVKSEGGHENFSEGVGGEQFIEKVMTVAETAMVLERSTRQVRRLAEAGRLPAVKTRNGWLFDRQAVTDYRAEQEWNCAS